MKNKYQAAAYFLSGLGMVCILLMKLQQNCINRWKGAAGKDRALFLLMDQWVRIKHEDKNLGEYFLKNSYRRIAIYGMGCAGRRLVKELEGSGVETVYGIDRNAANIYSEIKLVTPEDKLPIVDAVVVTSMGGFDEICDMLIKKLDCPIIAIEDIINEL